MELARQRDWAEQQPSLWHYRDKQQREAGVVLYTGQSTLSFGEHWRPCRWVGCGRRREFDSQAGVGCAG